MPSIQVKGKASQKIYGPWEVPSQWLNQSLMDFLRFKKLPIASSCLGEGHCLKCVTSSNVATCQITVAEYLKTFGHQVAIDYL